MVKSCSGERLKRSILVQILLNKEPSLVAGISQTTFGGNRNPEESGGIRRNPNPKKSYANIGIPVPQEFLQKIPVKAAENRNFQDPSKITFLGRSSSGNNREKRNPLESWQEWVFGN